MPSVRGYPLVQHNRNIRKLPDGHVLHVEVHQVPQLARLVESQSIDRVRTLPNQSLTPNVCLKPQPHLNRTYRHNTVQIVPM